MSLFYHLSGLSDLRYGSVPKSPFWKCKSCRVQNWPSESTCRVCKRKRVVRGSKK